MAEIKAFRFLGPGVLHIKRTDGRLAVIPPYEPGITEQKCIVKDPVNIESLGQPRIASLIAAGQAEQITWSDQLASFLHPDAKGFNPETGEGNPYVFDIEASEAHLQETHVFESAVQAQTAELAKNMSPAEKEAAAMELRKIGLGGTVATRGTDQPAFTPAGPDR